MKDNNYFVVAVLIFAMVLGSASSDAGEKVPIDSSRNDFNSPAKKRKSSWPAQDRQKTGLCPEECFTCGKWNPGHYIQVSTGTTREYIEEILLNPNNHIKGVLVGYLWAALEPEKNKYDFSTINNHLALVRKYNKQLFVFFDDRSFGGKEKTIPDYLNMETKYRSGAVRTQGGGTVARIWDQAIMERSNRLIEELGKRFDGNPNFEGIVFGESSLDIDERETEGYSNKAYADALISRIDSAARSFPNSIVLMYMNWGPKELTNVLEYLPKAGVGMGGPDLVPDRGRFDYRPRIPAYDYFPKFAGKIPLSIAVQSENLVDPMWFFKHCKSRPNDAICRKDNKGNYMKRKGSFELEDFWDMALNTLKVNYVFWVPVKEPRYKFKFRENILPYINSHKGEINTACPEKRRILKPECTEKCQ